MSVRVPVHVLGIHALPSKPSHVGPPSQERSSQTESLVNPLSMLPQAMASTSETCRTRRRPLTIFVATGNVSDRAREGSRVSQ